jgi:hypothetical protein
MRVERLAFQERLSFRDALRADEREERVRADEGEERLEQTRERSGQSRRGRGAGCVSGRQYTADERDALRVHSDSGELGRDVEELVDGARERLRIVLGGPSAATWHAKDETRCDLATDGMGWG